MQLILLSPRSGVEGLVLFAAGLAALVSIGHYVRKAVTLAFRFFKRMDRALDNVERQLYPNGGKSLRDGFDRLELAQATMLADLADMKAASKQRLDSVEQALRAAATDRKDIAADLSARNDT